MLGVYTFCYSHGMSVPMSERPHSCCIQTADRWGFVCSGFDRFVVFVYFNASQEIEFLTSSIGQLKIVQTKYVEAKDSLNVLNKNNKGK